MKDVDIVIITNLPSFYKINLYNLLSEKVKLFVIFTGDTAGFIRNNDFFSQSNTFEHCTLKGGSFKKGIQLLNIIFSIEYKELIIGGWDSFPLWMAAFFSLKSKNAVVLESSYLESNTTGIIGFFKSLFIKRINKVYASGVSQKKLALSLNFKGRVIITNGVGIFNFIPQPKYKKVRKVYKFLYVGRLSKEKNLTYLIKTFDKFKHLELNIIGFGPQEKELKELSKNITNVTLLGPIKNKELSNYYQENHVFILPSISEPWGLVVEEALNNGIPVIVSDRVGCANEIVLENENGIIFTLNDSNSLSKAIVKMSDNIFYNKLRLNISRMDYTEIALKQVECYLN